MNKDQNLRICPRCQSENAINHNFCWLCGIGLNEHQHQYDHPAPAQKRPQSVATSVGSGIAGVLAGALGGIMIGLLIVVAFVMTVLNAIGEFFESCAGMLIFMLLAFSTAIYSIVSWLF